MLLKLNCQSPRLNDYLLTSLLRRGTNPEAALEAAFASDGVSWPLIVCSRMPCQKVDFAAEKGIPLICDSWSLAGEQRPQRPLKQSCILPRWPRSSFLQENILAITQNRNSGAMTKKMKKSIAGLNYIAGLLENHLLSIFRHFDFYRN